jgi:hypothetical protein
VASDILRHMADEDNDLRFSKKRYMVVERFEDTSATYRRLN